METNNKKALEILYFLEDKGLTCDYTDWDNLAYFTFSDEQDYNNAKILLPEYFNSNALNFNDDKLEIEIDLSSLNESMDSITENLIEADMVEDDLKDIIEDCISEYDNNNISLVNKESTEDELDEIFDGFKLAFNSLNIYQGDEGDIKASFTLCGNLNQSDFSYLRDLEEILTVLELKTGLKAILYKEEVNEDTWFAKIVLCEPLEEQPEDEDVPLDEEIVDETYTKDELNSFKNKVFNQRKVMSIYRKKKYGKNRLMCRTKCVNCGREKKLFLSNLVTNPEKYGSCICSDKNIESRYDLINGLYKGTKKLKNNTSGYTGVSWVSTYGGEPYNKWRAYIDIDNHRNYLGDFSSKSKAIRARKAAAAKGIKWYQENKDQFMATSRRNRKKKRRAKLKKA